MDDFDESRTLNPSRIRPRDDAYMFSSSAKGTERKKKAIRDLSDVGVVCTHTSSYLKVLELDDCCAACRSQQTSHVVSHYTSKDGKTDWTGAMDFIQECRTRTLSKSKAEIYTFMLGEYKRCRQTTIKRKRDRQYDSLADNIDVMDYNINGVQLCR